MLSFSTLCLPPLVLWHLPFVFPMPPSDPPCWCCSFPGLVSAVLTCVPPRSLGRETVQSLLCATFDKLEVHVT